MTAVTNARHVCILLRSTEEAVAYNLTSTRLGLLQLVRSCRLLHAGLCYSAPTSYTHLIRDSNLDIILLLFMRSRGITAGVYCITLQGKMCIAIEMLKMFAHTSSVLIETFSHFGYRKR